MTQLGRVLAAIDACADRLDELHQTYPHLSSQDIEQSVAYWRKVRPGIEIETSTKPKGEGKVTIEQPDQSAAQNRDKVRQIAVDLLNDNGLEDTLDILHSKHNVDLTIKNLVALVGKTIYLSALQQDAKMLRQNAISYDQIAELWNDLERPASGGTVWTAKTVSLLLES